MITLHQQIGRDGSVFDFDRVRRDGKSIGIIGRHAGAKFIPHRRMADVELAAVLEGIAAARGEAVEVGMQPPSAEAIREYDELATEETEDDDE